MSLPSEGGESPGTECPRKSWRKEMDGTKQSFYDAPGFFPVHLRFVRQKITDMTSKYLEFGCGSWMESAELGSQTV